MKANANQLRIPHTKTHNAMLISLQVHNFLLTTPITDDQLHNFILLAISTNTHCNLVLNNKMSRWVIWSAWFKLNLHSQATTIAIATATDRINAIMIVFLMKRENRKKLQVNGNNKFCCRLQCLQRKTKTKVPLWGLIYHPCHLFQHKRSISFVLVGLIFMLEYIC